MPQKSPRKKVSTPTTLQLYQVGYARQQRAKQATVNQGVLILSTPIKQKDGSVNIEQRAIPLRMNEDQSVMSGERKNKAISIKRSNEPPPLALPIDQLNKKLPTFVKNEVGQVMGKLIPLGKFSNIASNATDSANRDPAHLKDLKRDLSETFMKPRMSKMAKLKADAKKMTDAMNENVDMKLCSNAKSATIKNTSPTTLSNVRNMKTEGPITTLTSAKPKKQVHLVLKGDKNMASIGQTGRNIKLIPLDQWNLGTKLNAVKTMSNSSSQAKNLNVRSCMTDEANDDVCDDNKNDPPYYDPSKLSCIIKEEDFSLNDPLGMEDMPMVESRVVVNSGELSDSIPRFDSDAMVTCAWSKRLPPESVDLKPSGMITLMNGTKAVRLKINNVSRTKSFRLKEESPVSPKREVVSQHSNPRTEEGEEEIEEAEEGVMTEIRLNEEETEVRKTEDDSDRYQRYGVRKSEMTRNESTMMGHIRTLRRKLRHCENSKARLLEVAEQRHSRMGLSYLTNTQRRFVELQLRNSKNLKLIRRRWFTKIEVVVAQRILKAIGPTAYGNLRKLFSLPSRSVVAKVTSKT